MRRIVDWFLQLPVSTLYVIQMFALIVWHMPKMGDLSPFFIFVPGFLASIKLMFGLGRSDNSALHFLNLIARPIEPVIEPPTEQVQIKADDPGALEPLYKPLVVRVGPRPAGWRSGQSVTENVRTGTAL